MLALQAQPDTLVRSRRRCCEGLAQSGVQEAKQHAMEGERHVIKGRELLWGCSFCILPPQFCPVLSRSRIYAAKERPRQHTRSRD